MIENTSTLSYKAMKLTFYIPTEKQYAGGRRNVHFKFLSSSYLQKRRLKKMYKKRYEYKIQRPLLETLNSYIEASKCRTLDTFASTEVKTK